MSIIFSLSYILVAFGILINGLIVMLPVNMQAVIPSWMRLAFMGVGLMLGVFGVCLPHTRAKKTGAEHLIEFARPSTLIWFYVYRDGTVKITPAIREVEGQLYSKELDAQIHDLKSYRLFDHSIRFVPEGIGHAVDLDVVLYTTLLRNKYGFTNIREAREAGFKGLLSPQKEQVSNEKVGMSDERGNIQVFSED